MRYLADTSIWGWARSGRRPDITAKLAERLERDEVVTCVPVMLEVMHRARDAREYEAVFETLFAPLDVVPLGQEQSLRAMAIQRELSGGTDGNHLRPATDLLIAAVAESAGNDIAVWAFDRDLRVICEHTGQPFEAEDSSGPGT